MSKKRRDDEEVIIARVVHGPPAPPRQAPTPTSPFQHPTPAPVSLTDFVLPESANPDTSPADDDSTDLWTHPRTALLIAPWYGVIGPVFFLFMNQVQFGYAARGGLVLGVGAFWLLTDLTLYGWMRSQGVDFWTAHLVLRPVGVALIALFVRGQSEVFERYRRNREADGKPLEIEPLMAHVVGILGGALEWLLGGLMALLFSWRQ